MTEAASDDTTIVRGVVHASGASGVKSRGEAQWTLQFSLEPWREEGGPLQPERLSVHRAVSEAELKVFMDRIEAYDLVRVRVRFVDGRSRAEMIELLGRATGDAELAEHAARLQQPATIEDSFFGALTLDRRLDWYDADAVWAGAPIKVHFSPDEGGRLDTSLETAKALWQDQAGWQRRIRDYAVQELLPLKNDAWLEEGEAEVTAEEFEARMTLESVIVFPDGAFEFFHDDGELFWGHTILVCGTLEEGPTQADIPG